MTSPQSQQIRPPAHFDRASKAEFRRVLATLSGNLDHVSADDLADFVSCRQRIRWLEEQFAKEYFQKDRRAISRDLNAAVALSQRLADRLQKKDSI